MSNVIGGAGLVSIGLYEMCVSFCQCRRLRKFTYGSPDLAVRKSSEVCKSLDRLMRRAILAVFPGVSSSSWKRIAKIEQTREKRTYPSPMESWVATQIVLT